VRLRRAGAALLLALLVASAAGAASAGSAAKPAPLSEKHAAWLADHELLLSSEELAAFRALTADYQRDAFIESFWRERDPHTDTARNELREMWQARLEEAKRLFGNLADPRSRTLLLNGPPDLRHPIDDCNAVWPLEVWFYRQSKRIPEDILIIFYQAGGVGAFRLWDPGEGEDVLSATAGTVFRTTPDESTVSSIMGLCKIDDAGILSAAVGASRRGGEFGWVQHVLAVQKLEAPVLEPAGEWLATFASYSTDLPAEATTFPASVRVAYPGRRGVRVVTQAVVELAAADVGVTEVGGGRSRHLLATGEVLRDGALLDRFRYRFDFPVAPDVAAESLPLAFERLLRPGDYELVVLLHDVAGDRFHRSVIPLVVPNLEQLAEIRTPIVADDPSTRLLAEANALLDGPLVSVELLRPVGESVLAGKVRFDALVNGAAVARVDFWLDDAIVASKRTTPWSLELELGRLPRPRMLRAVARDAAGATLAEDELVINASSQRFAVRIVEPRKGQAASASTRLVAAVDVPRGDRLDRLEIWRDETLVATLYQPPWEQPVTLAGDGAIAALRAVAYLPDGTSTAADVLVNAPAGLEEVEVRLVELYTSVVDRAGRQVEGLQAADFAVREDDAPQEIVRFERVADLPIRVGLLLDVSSSMKESLAGAQHAAMGFFREVVGVRDRAALITFNDRPHLAVELTRDLPTLGGGLAGLVAERGTALHDAVAFGLYYFNGVAGQRALVVLSDGKDESSRFTLDETLELARRAGVTLYGIGLGEGGLEREAKRALERLSEETGGRAFFPAAPADLAAVYAAIEEEMRGKYLLVYQSSQGASGDDFRTVEVEVARRGAEARTLRGYFP
jgi:VWFA-related protein